MDLNEIYRKLKEKYKDKLVGDGKAQVEVGNLGNESRRRSSEAGWWPVSWKDERFEIIVGVVLTQNTSWKNVQKALVNLADEGLDSAEAILECDDEKLKEMIKPAGYYNQKAEYLKNIARFYIVHKKQERQPTREELLEIKGIGKESADSILLYGYDIPVFVIDAYTKRVIRCLASKEGMDFTGHSYDEFQDMFHQYFKELDVSEKVRVFKEFHGLIVEFCKDVCVKGGKGCEGCVL